MKIQKLNSAAGFTFVELMISMAVGLIVLGAIATMFNGALNATKVVTQRSQVQQDMRAAVDLMVKDITLAGAGLTSGIQLPSGAGSTVSKYGCDQTGTCHVPNGTYPTVGAVSNYLYGVVPGYLNGVEGGASIPAAPAPAVNDALTVVYSDVNFPLSGYSVAFGGTNDDQITLTAAAGQTPQLITAAGGINVGDLIMLTNSAGTAVGEVTGLTSSGTSGTSSAAGTMTFANADPLNINQNGVAASNTIKSIAAGSSTVATRIFVISYYISVPAAGGTVQTPRLMRQVNGLTPVPVADNIINVQFTYDVYNSAIGALDSNQANPIGAAESPNNIQKVNLVIMGQSITSYGSNKAMYLATDVSVQNLAFTNGNVY
jgi:type II secretory pathway pseudopilin PulG